MKCSASTLLTAGILGATAFASSPSADTASPSLQLRIYGPEQAAFDGHWKPGDLTEIE